MKVAIIGGGSSAHLLAVLLAGRGHKVKILTSRPLLWNAQLELDTREGTLCGTIEGAGNDPVQIIGDAQVAFLCMPVHQYPVALARILPVLAVNTNCIVGTVYGQADFDKMVETAATNIGCNVPRHFAIGLLPWIARTKEYGQSSICYGPKYRNGIATSDQEVFDYLQDSILDDLSYAYWGTGRFERVPNFLTLTLTVDNQIIHPSRCYALTRESSHWNRLEDVPYFYRDWDDYSADILRGVDDDYTAVRKAIFTARPDLDSQYNMNYLELEHWSYGSHNPDIKASFVNSTTLGEIKPPVVPGVDGLYRLDPNHRFFKDDFEFGLEICKRYAKRYHCQTPHIDELVRWFSSDIRCR